MIWLVALAIWISISAGVYLILSRSLFRCLMGLSIVGASANLLLLSAGRLDSSLPAIVPVGQTILRDTSNPLPQALVLTAIVIGFALICFSLVLVLSLIQRLGLEDVRQLRYSEQLPTDPIKPPLADLELEPQHPDLNTSDTPPGRQT